jgi:cyclic pyranopterin phosphate synthase
MAFDDLIRLSRVLANLGVRKIKITGGEPTLRPERVELVSTLKAIEGLDNVTLTTNGLLLEKLAQPLAKAGLDSVNVSLDTLDPEFFWVLTGSGRLETVLRGLQAAFASGIPSVKINAVPQATTPHSDLLSLVKLAKERPIHVRFIELMPIGPGAGLSPPPSPAFVKEIIESQYGPLIPVHQVKGNGPAEYFRLLGFQGMIGFISALASCFCSKCNRLRVTADGCLKTCLHMDKGVELPLQDERALTETILTAVRLKPERHLMDAFSGTNSADDRTMNRIGG